MPAMNPKSQADSIRDMIGMLSGRSAPQAPFSDSIPSVADINTPVYEGDASYPGGPRGMTLTPPRGAPAPGSAASIAAAHQRRRAGL